MDEKQLKFKLVDESGKALDISGLQLSPGVKTILCVNVQSLDANAVAQYMTGLKQCLDDIGAKDYVLMPVNDTVGKITKIDLD